MKVSCFCILMAILTNLKEFCKLVCLQLLIIFKCTINDFLMETNIMVLFGIQVLFQVVLTTNKMEEFNKGYTLEKD